MLPARLACVKHAASVRSEPGSNSQVHTPDNLTAIQLRTTLHSLSHQQSQPSQRQPDTKPDHTQRHHHLSAATPGRRPRIPPLTPAAHHRPPARPRLNPQPSLSPAPSHPHRTAKNQTLPKPMQLSKNNPPKPAGHHPSRGNNQPPERNRPISGPTNLVTPRPPVNPPHQRRGGASTHLTGVCQTGFVRFGEMRTAHGYAS